MVLSIIRHTIHYGFHFVLPGWISVKFYPINKLKTYFIFLSAMLIDLDHFLAHPLFDASRCSIGFHPLHSYIAFGLYCLLLLPKRTRILGIGLCLHLITDLIDCIFIHLFETKNAISLLTI